MQLKVEMYVRLDRNQGIRKIDELTENNRFILDESIYDEYGDSEIILDENDVIKASYNLIDLIEEGDVIEYDILCGLETNNLLHIINHVDKDMLFNIKNDKNFKLKSVVTKEQFNSMKYEVNE